MTNLQKTMKNLATQYTKKLGGEIAEVELYTQALSWKTTSGRKFTINISESRTSSLPYIYLNEVIGKKKVRIPKDQW